jgi:cleavage and polyadenylation specificity factor subunit 1
MIQNLPYDAYKLLAVPSPIGGVLVLCANTIHYYSQVLPLQPGI